MFGPRGKRWLSAAVMVTMLTTLGACGGDEPAASPQTTDPSATRADSEAEVRARWDEYWRVRVAIENSGEFDGAAFSEVARDDAVESQSRRDRSYEKSGLVRVGEPTFRDVEIRLDDTSAVVLGCFNADDWTAKIDGKPWSAKKYGWELTGSVMKQVDGTWFVVDEMSSKAIEDAGKTC